MKKLSIAVIVFTIFISQACTSRYVGRYVNMAAPGVCTCHMFPKTCELSTDQFKVFWTLTEIEKDRYRVEGSADYIGPGPWRSYEGVLFMVLLIDNGRIVESVSAPGGQGPMDKTIIFEKEFTAQHKFSATALNCTMTVRG